MVVLDSRGLVAGEFHGIPPSGKRYTNRGAVYFHIENGKIADVETNFDDVNIVTEQLGQRSPRPSNCRMTLEHETSKNGGLGSNQ